MIMVYDCFFFSSNVHPIQGQRATQGRGLLNEGTVGALSRESKKCNL